jgi:hypothetical protein
MIVLDIKLLQLNTLIHYLAMEESLKNIEKVSGFQQQIVIYGVRQKIQER